MVAQIWLILSLIWDAEAMNVPLYLVYALQFNIIPQLSTLPPTHTAIPNPITSLYLLKCTLYTDQSCMGGIIPLSHCCMPIQLVPHFGAKADTGLTCTTSMEHSREFFFKQIL